MGAAATLHRAARWVALELAKGHVTPAINHTHMPAAQCCSPAFAPRERSAACVCGTATGRRTQRHRRRVQTSILWSTHMYDEPRCTLTWLRIRPVPLLPRRPLVRCAGATDRLSCRCRRLSPRNAAGWDCVCVHNQRIAGCMRACNPLEGARVGRGLARGGLPFRRSAGFGMAAAPAAPLAAMPCASDVKTLACLERCRAAFTARPAAAAVRCR